MKQAGMGKWIMESQPKDRTSIRSDTSDKQHATNNKRQSLLLYSHPRDTFHGPSQLKIYLGHNRSVRWQTDSNLARSSSLIALIVDGKICTVIQWPKLLLAPDWLDQTEETDDNTKWAQDLHYVDKCNALSAIL